MDIQEERIYIAIDLKSFYASVECVERGLDPLSTNLVVADVSRTEKTICLAVSPSLKAYGIPGRARLFEVIRKVKEVNRQRRYRAPDHKLTGESWDDTELKSHPELAVGYITAPPRMAYYMKHSAEIYNIYLKYIAPEDIHVYSIDEVIMDITSYLSIYKMSARDLAMTMIRDVLKNTGITATAGIGTNMYLCKIAMDIVAKHAEPDRDGVRIAELDEMTYREKLWTHRPLTDFWRVGRGYAKKLESHGLYTMGDIARCSIGGPLDFYNEELLYRLFGINAELLIDHAWGWEPCTMADVKAYQPESSSFSSGQVLQCPYTFEKARLVVQEMADTVALDLVDKGLVTDQMVLTIGYDIENLTDPVRRIKYKGPVTTDHYGRQVPKHAHGTANLGRQTSSGKLITEAVLKLFDEIVNPELLVRRLTVTTNHVADEATAKTESVLPEQLNLFTDYEALEKKRQEEEAILEKERKLQEAILTVKKKYGKNAVLKGMNLEEGATGRERNNQIGGHRA
ncbi:MAG: DNA methylase [Lachnospiraceae bacterium]|nr:DNA methylase [Lachnospiraceae bacterium]